MRRAVALALAGLAVWAAPALADPGITFDVDGRSVVVSADQLAASADVAGTTYTVDGLPQPLSGTSLRTALGLAGADPDAISAVTASADLALLQLTRPDVADLPPFPEGPALVWVDGEGRTSLLRPATAAGRAAQVVRSAPGAPLQATVDGASLLDVAVIVSVEEAKAGQIVPLMARSSAQDATYTWDFGDGTTDAGAKVEHRFSQRGRYRITVTADDGAGGGGTSRPVTIVVGAPKRRDADAVRATDAQRSSASRTGSEATAATPRVAPAAAAATPEPAPAAEPKAEREPAQTPKPNRAAPRRKPVPDPDAVSGTLVADVSTPDSLAIRQAAVAAPVPDRGGFPVPPIVWIVLGAAVAASLGVLVERRR